MLVEQWMTKDPPKINQNTNIVEAIEYFRNIHHRRLPVVDDAGQLVGMVTDKDLREATPANSNSLSLYELNYLASKLTIADIMQKDIDTITPETPLEKAAVMLDAKQVSGLAVVKNGVLYGIFTINNMLEACINFWGLREGGVRVCIRVPDGPNVLTKVTALAAPANIVAVVTANLDEEKHREILLRVVGDGSENFAKRLENADIEVLNVQ